MLRFQAADDHNIVRMLQFGRRRVLGGFFFVLFVFCRRVLDLASVKYKRDAEAFQPRFGSKSISVIARRQLIKNEQNCPLELNTVKGLVHPKTRKTQRFFFDISHMFYSRHALTFIIISINMCWGVSTGQDERVL